MKTSSSKFANYMWNNGQKKVYFKTYSVSRSIYMFKQSVRLENSGNQTNMWPDSSLFKRRSGHKKCKIISTSSLQYGKLDLTNLKLAYYVVLCVIKALTSMKLLSEVHL